jgi:hypothetical protein
MSTSRLMDRLVDTDVLVVRQKFEMAELVGLETRNKYAVEDGRGVQLAWLAESGRSLGALVFRSFLGHWRPFTIDVYLPDRAVGARLVHPFRFWLQRLEVVGDNGRLLGALEQRFTFFSRQFDIWGPDGELIATAVGPFWRPWTFRLSRAGIDIAVVRKQWGGLLSEAFTDKDVFGVEIIDAPMSGRERLMLLAAAVFVDLMYFERKAD